MMIGLTGYARSGKDTVAEILVKHFGYQRVAFAKNLKDLALHINPVIPIPLKFEGDDTGHLSMTYTRLKDLVDLVGWEDAKAFDEVRELLQRIGQGVRLIDPDFWVYSLELPNTDRIVISDARHPNEVDFVLTGNAGKLFRVVRPGVEPPNGHISETALEQMDLPVINNDGTLDDLESKVVRLFTNLLDKQ